ncbi:hypothetical protein Hanom_Chr07g00615221 [Helianthus anomalus]
MYTAITLPDLTPAAKAGLSSTLRSLLNHTILHPPDIPSIIHLKILNLDMGFQKD